MNGKWIRKVPVLLLVAATAVFLAACGFGRHAEQRENTRRKETGEEVSGVKEIPKGSDIDASGGFAGAHDAFTTLLKREECDDDPIPEPPEGVFDLVYYPSKVGDLAAYVSSDPGDGEKHPLIIWVVGGWGNGIDDFPFAYPEWENDQTGSAFWQNGILTMYPSFRGGNGNPGYYEALFGEVDDIVSAYEYAASLPYVDPERIYLGGHSTGGTRALLASEYTDKFRAVFCFGAVDEIKYHNSSQFTFDTGNKDEHIMRSPIYWLDNIKSPTFLIEGRDGNSENLERMERSYQSDSLHYFVVEDADHFSVLAPATEVVAEKILADTGEEVNIDITWGELDEAMKRGRTKMPSPVMTKRYIEAAGVTFYCPYLWEITENAERGGLDLVSRYDEWNPWDMSLAMIDLYEANEEYGQQELIEDMEAEGYSVEKILIDGREAIDAVVVFDTEEGATLYQRYLSINTDFGSLDFNFIAYEEFMEEAKPIFQDIVDSIQFDT